MDDRGYQGVLAAGKGETMEAMISEPDYGIPSNISIYCRVTEGGATLDAMEWFKVPWMIIGRPASLAKGVGTIERLFELLSADNKSPFWVMR